MLFLVVIIGVHADKSNRSKPNKSRVTLTTGRMEPRWISTLQTCLKHER